MLYHSEEFLINYLSVGSNKQSYLCITL